MLILISAFLIIACPFFLHAQDVTVTAKGLPDDSISQSYIALDNECRRLVNKIEPVAKQVAVEEHRLEVGF